MKPKENTKKYDVIVVGAGSGGLTSAIGFSKIGKRVLLVEREAIGGECTNSGCIPSKALLHHAKMFYEAQKIGGNSENLETYRAGAFEYVQAKIQEVLDLEKPDHFASLGIDVVFGEAEFVGPCEIRVDDAVYDFKIAVIATGSSPRVVPVEGLKEEDVFTNQNIFSLKKIPKQLLIMGGGPIGVELGQAFAMLGSEVTIVTNESVFLSRDERKVAHILEEKYKDLGIKIILEAQIQKVSGNVAYIETKDIEKGIQKVPFDTFLMAIGRVPNLPRGLKEAHVAFDEKSICIDRQFRTTNKKIYAVGDVSLVYKFTHTADDAAQQVVTHIASRGVLRPNVRKAVPRVTYTSPEVASVGLTHKQACDIFNEREIIRIEVPYSLNDRARTDDELKGILIIVARRVHGIVLGAHAVGHDAGNLISLLTVAMDRKISLWRLRSIIFPYPTYGSLIKKAGDVFLSETMSSLKQDIGFLFKKHITKIFGLIFWSVLLFTFFRYQTVHGLTNKEILIMIHGFATQTAWGPVMYMAVYVLRPLIFFPATLLTVLAGVLFGLPLGILYTIIGENGSANFAYWIGRFFGKDLRLENTFLGNWVDALRRRPFMSVLFMRLFYVPFDLTNYGAGVLRVSWLAYTTATFIGILGPLTTFVALGASVEDITSFELSFDAFNLTNVSIAVGVFVVSLVLSRYLQRWHRAQTLYT